jgi:hypothetical protein
LGTRLDTCFEFLIHPLIHALGYKACNNAYKAFDVFSTSPARAIVSPPRRYGLGGGGGNFLLLNRKPQNT